MQQQQRDVEVATREELGSEEAPVDGPLEHELTPDVERAHHVADRVDQKEGQTQQNLDTAKESRVHEDYDVVW